MQRVIPLVALVALALPVATADAAPRFRAAAYGNSARGIVQKTSFPIGAGYALRFTDTQRARTRFRLCAFFKGADRRCVSGRTGARGRPAEAFSIGIYNPQTTGTLTWRWSVGGRAVARVRLRITAGD